MEVSRQQKKKVYYQTQVEVGLIFVVIFIQINYNKIANR